MAERSRIETSEQAAGHLRRQERKPYTAPTLRRLGSVRELTLGTANGCISDGGTMAGKNMQMAMLM
jgi:hypothetical protein